MWFCIILSWVCSRTFSLVTICDHLTSYASYLLVVSSYLCSNVSIWCYCFKCLKFWKKMSIFVFFEVVQHVPIFSTNTKLYSRPSPILSPIRYMNIDPDGYPVHETWLVCLIAVNDPGLDIRKWLKGNYIDIFSSL